MPEQIGVETTGLTGTGIGIGALADELASAATGAAAAADGGAASQHPALSAGAATFAEQWGRALAVMRESTGQLGQKLGASGSAYEMTDSQGPLSRVG